MVVIGYYAVYFVGDNIIKPKYMKKGLDISFLMVIVSLIFWSWVLGAVGAILAVPLTLTVKKFLQQYFQEAYPLAAASEDAGTASAHARGGKKK